MDYKNAKIFNELKNRYYFIKLNRGISTDILNRIKYAMLMLLSWLCSKRLSKQRKMQLGITFCTGPSSTYVAKTQTDELLLTRIQ